MNYLDLVGSVPIVAWVFIAVVTILTVYFGWFKFTGATVSNAPTVLTSIGIFGTFLGITLSLAEFNTADIHGSIDSLLNGLKTAFWSSIAGLLGAIIIKGKYLFQISSGRANKDEYKSATIDDLANELRKINKGLAGDDDSALLTQFKLMRQDSNDRLDALRRAFDEFKADMAKSNSEALIEALREVIRDFNAKINEQFGDNFKQLNEAVGKILEWQELYREQMAEMIAQQSETAANMETATTRYGELVSEAEAFSEIAESLHAMIEATNTQREQLEFSLKELSALVEAVRTGLPDVTENLNKMTESVTTAVQENAEQVSRSVISANEQMTEVLSRSNNEFNGHIKQIVEKTQQQVGQLDQALSEELTKSLTSLGQQLTALSERFVTDYEPLTTKLQALVSMTGRVTTNDYRA